MRQWLLPLLGLIAFEAVADVLAVSWSRGRAWAWALAALFFYLVCNSCWLWALGRGAGLARGANIFSVASAILAAVLGVYIFDEHITRPQALGLVLGLVALALMCWE